MRILLKLIAALLGIVVVAVAGLTVYLSMFFDPNEYKPLIIEQARKQANAELTIDGDIGWSVFPWLGLELGQTSVAPVGDEALASIRQVQVGVRLLPLLAGQVQMSGILLDGLQADLRVDEQGRGNWASLGPQDGADASATTPAETTAQNDGGSLPSLDIASLEIRDASLRYRDAQSGQDVELSRLSLQSEDIAFGEAFPLQLRFSLTLKEPALQVDTELSARASVDPDQQRYALQDLDLRSTLSGEPFGDQQLPVTVRGGLQADLVQQVANLQDLVIGIADMKAELQAGVTGLDQQPSIDGRLDIEAFSVRELLAALGQPAIDTADPAVLQRVAFNTLVKSSGDEYRLDGITLQLDDTKLSGNARVNAATQAAYFRLQGDAIDVDRYLPPASEAPAGEQAAASGGGAAGGGMLPVETLRSLNLDGEFTLARLKVSGITITELALKVLGKGGLLDLQKMNGKLYDGTFSSSAQIDVRGKTPSLRIKEQVSGVALGPLLQDLAGEQRASGTFNLDADFTTRGNDQQSWMRHLGGNAGFGLSDGAVHGYNLNRQVCSGLARLNKTELPAQQWGTSTPIDQASGQIRFTDGVGQNDDLLIKLAGMQVAGKGQVNLASETLDYRSEVAIVGQQLGEDNNACQVPEKYQRVKIPMRCQGSFQDEPASLCGLDFAGLLKDEAKRRVEEKIDEKLGDKLGEEGKQLLKGLFGR